jgi:vacuolar protein sorting-associated protein 13A/C
MTGLVIKPISGIMDATTKTAEGIKNTANFLSESDNDRRAKRIHKPRPFYSYLR